MQRIPAGPAGPQPEPPSRRTGYLFKGAGLVAVAVVSGFLWWLIRHDGDEPPSQAQGGEKPAFDYKLAEGPKVASDCAANSYGEVKKWFGDHQCTRLSRALYTVNSGKAKVLVSVSLVTMPSPDLAAGLKQLTDTDDAGNVTDLVKDGTAKIAKAPKVAGGEYASNQAGAEVTIVEAAFFEKHEDKALLHRITTGALHLDSNLR
ncbi:hypothetical protein [Amycolatopsis minnesotensis]|uniref:Secreted protein n=1 Tax=Amycolatopsis minnesotensis TaxID=337894 RepID=A0ABP5BGU4_9PSEU